MAVDVGLAVVGLDDDVEIGPGDWRPPTPRQYAALPDATVHVLAGGSRTYQIIDPEQEPWRLHTAEWPSARDLWVRTATFVAEEYSVRCLRGDVSPEMFLAAGNLRRLSRRTGLAVRWLWDHRRGLAWEETSLYLWRRAD